MYKCTCALILCICVYVHLYCTYAYMCTCAYVYDKMMSIRMFRHFVYLENGSCNETKRRCYRSMKKYSSAGLLSLTTRCHWLRLFTVCASHSVWHFVHDYLFFLAISSVITTSPFNYSPNLASTTSEFPQSKNYCWREFISGRWWD